MDRFVRSLRLLPAVIAVAGLALMVKVGAIWVAVRDFRATSLVVAGAQAQEAKVPAAAPAADPPVSTSRPVADAEPTAPPPIDATRLSASEIDVLQRLSERRQALDAREQDINEQAALIRAAETRIDQKVTELKDLRATLEQLIKTHDEQETRKIGSLVKIYENMKPKDAARIFEELEMETLLLVAERMNERKLAPVMAEMNPSKAKQVTVELARRRQMPAAAPTRPATSG